MTYYDIWFEDSGKVCDKWLLEVPPELEDGSWWDVWAFTRCEKVKNVSPVKMEVSHGGRIVDFNWAEFDIPVVSTRVIDILQEIAPDEFQVIPVDLPAKGNWHILNVLPLVDCLDHEASVIQYYPEDHPERPGKPRGVYKLTIHDYLAANHHIFRIKDWHIVIVVSQVVKDALEAAEITGVRFRNVVE